MERNRGGRPRHPDVLTPAEWRVLDALREGGTNAEIASRLGLSPDTVKSHISNMLAKLELRDRRALAAWRPDAQRRRLGGVLAVPAALWSLGRPLAWVGAGVAALAGVAVVVVALVALEGIVERDGEPPAAVKPPPTTSTPAAAPAAPGSCATPDDPTCIHAVYIGAPGDYAQVVDVPATMRLSGGPGGTYRVDAGLEVTVVTAARLPEGWTRFYLDQSPIGDPPVSASQLIPPVGTTYTFTVSDEATASTTITYDLKQARPFVRPRPDGKPEIGATVVETEFEVLDCSSGVAVTNPDAHAELVGDCEALLGLRDTIRGTGKLNWTAGKAMADWMGVTVSGTPQRVTALNLAGLGLDGELSGLLGNLTGLTTLNLSGNTLTGMIPSKLALLTNLTSVTLSGTDFDGCSPAVLGDAATSDVTQADCGEPAAFGSFVGGPIPAGTYEIEHAPQFGPVIVLDWPADSGLMFVATARTLIEEGQTAKYGDLGLMISNAEGTVHFAIDIEMAGEWPRVFDDNFSDVDTATGYTRAEFEALWDRIVESMWVKGSE